MKDKSMKDMRGRFMQEYWNYRKEGGKLSMKDYSALKKEILKTDIPDSS